MEHPRPQCQPPRCAECGSEAVMFQVKKDSPNKGRWFFKCGADHKNLWFWADEYERHHPGRGAGAAGAGAGHGWGAGGGGAAAPGGLGRAPAPHGAPSWQQLQPPYQPQSPQGPATPQRGPGRGGAAPAPAHGAAGSAHGSAAGPGSSYGSPGYGVGAVWGQGGTGAPPQGAGQGWQHGLHQHGTGGASAYSPAPPQTPGVQQQWQQPHQAQQAQRGEGMVVQFQLLGAGSTEIGLRTASYQAPFRDVIMELSSHETGRRWKPELKCWTIHAHSYPTVRQHLLANGYVIEDVPEKVLQVLVQHSSPHSPRMSLEEARQLAERSIDPRLWRRLFRYQQEGVVAGLRFGGRLMLADEMGLGKTVQALTIMSAYTGDWPLLVICPTSLRYTWVAAVQEWLPAELQPADRDLWLVGASADWARCEQAAGLAPGGDGGGQGAGYGRGAARPHIAVISYDLAARCVDRLRGRYHSVICDESHSLKNRLSKRWKALAPLVRDAPRAVLCTGTPVMNRPIELWAQIDILRPGLLGSYDAYGSRYCVSQQHQQHQHQQQHQQFGGRGGGRGGGGVGWPGDEYRGAANLPELHALLAEAVLVRRLKKDVLADLPPKIRSKVPLQPSDADLRRVAPLLRDLDEAGRALAEAQAQGGQGGAAEREAKMAAQQAWSAAYRATGPAKVAETLAFIDRLLQIGTQDDDGTGPGTPAPPAEAGGDAGEDRPDEADGGEGGGGGPSKLLVFAHHREVLDRIGDHLRAHRVSCMRIDGDTPPAARDAAVRSFQGEGLRPGRRGPRVALLSLHAGGAGLTLTAASVVVFAELDPTPAVLAQAEDRVHRVGQGARHCHIYYLLGKGTLDDQIWQMLERKKFVVGATLDGGEAAAAAAAGADRGGAAGGAGPWDPSDDILGGAGAGGSPNDPWVGRQQPTQQPYQRQPAGQAYGTGAYGGSDAAGGAGGSGGSGTQAPGQALPYERQYGGAAGAASPHPSAAHGPSAAGAPVSQRDGYSTRDGGSGSQQRQPQPYTTYAGIGGGGGGLTGPAAGQARAHTSPPPAVPPGMAGAARTPPPHDPASQPPSQSRGGGDNAPGDAAFGSQPSWHAACGEGWAGRAGAAAGPGAAAAAAGVEAGEGLGGSQHSTSHRTAPSRGGAASAGGSGGCAAGSVGAGGGWQLSPAAAEGLAVSSRRAAEAIAAVAAAREGPGGGGGGGGGGIERSAWRSQGRGGDQALGSRGGASGSGGGGGGSDVVDLTQDGEGGGGAGGASRPGGSRGTQAAGDSQLGGSLSSPGSGAGGSRGSGVGGGAGGGAGRRGRKRGAEALQVDEEVVLLD